MAKRYIPIGILVTIAFTMALAVAIVFFMPVAKEATWGILSLSGRFIVGILILGAFFLIRSVRKRSKTQNTYPSMESDA